MSKIFMVTIDDRKHIPFVNRLGPITFPIPVKEMDYNALKKMGFNMTLVRVVDQSPKVVGEFQESLNAEVASKLHTDVAPPVLSVPEETPDLSGFVSESNDGVVVEIKNELPPQEEPQAEEVVVEETTEEDVEVEAVILTDEEIAQLEVSDLRDYILQFEGALTEKEVHTAKSAQHKRLLELAKAISKKMK